MYYVFVVQAEFRATSFHIPKLDGIVARGAGEDV